MKYIVLCLTLLFSAVAFAGGPGGSGGAAIPDPFLVPDISTMANVSICNGSWQCDAPYLDTSSKTLRNQTVNTGIRNLVLLVAGQSNNANTSPTAYTPANPTAIDNFNIFNGAMYAAADPQLGTTIGTTGPAMMDLRVADTLITNGKFDRVILVPMSVGGSAAYMWATLGGPTHSAGTMAGMPCVAMGRLAARGIVPGANVTFAMDWGQGESEAGLSTTQIQYQNYMTDIGTRLNSCGFSGRIFVNIETWVNGAYATVQTAQSAMAGTVIGNVTFFVGANLDSLNNTSRVDQTHFNDAGSVSGATLKYNAMHASGAPF